MKTLQFYKISTLVLLLLNLIMVGFFFLTSQRPPHEKNDFLNEAIEILQLNKSQAITFEELAKAHNDQMEKSQSNQLEWTKEYFEIKDNNIKSDSLLNLIKEGETHKIKITRNHFNDIKNILTNSQLPNYKEFEKEALNKILLQKRPKPKK